MANSTVWKVIYKADKKSEWKELIGNKGFWYADPILFKNGDSIYLFTEAFCNISQKGCLALSKFNNGEFSSPKIIMKRSIHLSYPCVFEYNNNVYMIPETGQKGTLELWKGSRDLEEWSKCTDLLTHVRYADTTVYVKDEKVYLFSYEEGKHYKTHIFLLNMLDFSIEKIEEIDHDKNIYRPAGKFFTCEEKLYRPVQYNVNNYGEKILINKIISLQPFREEYCREIKAEDFREELIGLNTHTYSVLGEMESADYLCPVDLPFFEKFVIIRKVRNMFFKIRFKLGF